MSTSALEKLMFTVGMKDMVSQPALSINKTITGMKQNATSGFDSIRGGALGLAGAGIAIKTFMQPVYDVEKALGEVKSLGVIESELKSLTKESLKFSMAYGEGAADFIRSSYDIQSAISGLTDGELAKFTTASNVLAKGTKADAATITSYMGTMYGIFSDQANKMGKAKWVEQLTGQTAMAVQMFKTDGANMSAAFTSIGADATASGVSLTEQMAIMGTLQATMSGAESGTKYKAFLAGVAGAQDKLGLSFTDSNGRLLPMLSILDTLKGKFGSSFSEMEGLELKKAFGSGEAVSLIKLLMNQTDSLTGSMDKLGKITGMKNAVTMAKAMVDPWEQFQSVTEAVRISFGTLLMPTVNDFLSMLSGGMQTLIGWTEAFPNITKYVGLAAMSILGMSAATGLFAIVMGLGQTAMAAFGVVTLALKGSMFLLNAAFVMGKALMIGMGVGSFLMATAMGALNVVIGAGKLLWFGLNAVMMMNPISLIVLAVGGLIVAVGSLFGVWGKLGDMFKNSSWGKSIMALFDNIMAKFESFKSMFGMDGSVTANVNGAYSAPNDVLPGVMPQHSSTDAPTINGMGNSAPSSANKEGLAKQIAGHLGSAGATFGDVTINAEGGLSPEAMEEWSALQGG